MVPDEHSAKGIIVDHLLPVVFSLLCISAKCAARARGPNPGVFGRCLSCAPLPTLAGYSYAIYVLQVPVFKLYKFFQPSCPQMSWLRGPLLPVVMCHVVGVIAHHLIQE